MQTIKFKRWIPHIVVGAIITLPWAIWSGFEYWSWIIFYTTFLIGSIGGSFLIDRHNHSFTKRIEQSNVVIWNVLMSGVEVGFVPDAVYASMQKSAFNNWHNVVKQFFNVVCVIHTIITKLCNFIPFVAFWVVATTIIVTPEYFSGIVHELQNSAPAEITLAVKSLLKTCITFSVIIISFMFMTGARFGFKNVYSDAVACMVRQHLRIPAKGEILLYHINTNQPLPQQPKESK